MALGSGAALGQSSATLYLIRTQNLDALSQAELAPGVPNDDNRLWIGHRPSAIAYGLGRLFVGGEVLPGPLPRDGDDADNDGNRTELTPFNISIVKIDDFLTAPAYRRIPASRYSVDSGFGYTGMDHPGSASSTVSGLVAAYDTGGGGPNLLSRYTVDQPGDGVLAAPMPTLFSGFRLGSAGPAWDFGPSFLGIDYLPAGAPDGIPDGPVVAALVIGEVGPFGINPSTLNAAIGATAYEVNINNGPRLVPDAEGNRTWRDLSINTGSGSLAARADNTVIYARREITGLATRVDLAPANPATERLAGASITSTPFQRVAILSGFNAGGVGELMVWNDRSSTAAGQPFNSVVRFNKTERPGNPAENGAPVTVTILNPDNTPATLPAGDAAYDFHWDSNTQLLFVADAANRNVYVLTANQPVACCLPTGVCALLTVAACGASGIGGTAGAPGSVCTPTNPCPQPTIACCLPSGVCQLTTPVPCGTLGGTAQAVGVTCTPNPCVIVTGACCTGTTCAVVAQTACTGVYRGGGTTCLFTGNPVTCCPANYNQVGGLSVQDIFDYLSDYFSGHPNANFNGINGVSVQDIFDFLFAYFQGCPG
jgi:hypothetical protein